MSISQISICNLALSWLGGNLITSLQDDSTEAKLCSANYDSSRNATIEDRNWSFASTRAIPARLADAPVFQYSYHFQLPKNPLCIRVTKVYSDTSYIQGVKDWVREGDKILCNYSVIHIKYLKEVVDPTQFSPGFVQSFAARLAADICVPLTHDKELFANYWQLYLNKLESAGANDSLQGMIEPMGEKQLISIR